MEAIHHRRPVGRASHRGPSAVGVPMVQDRSQHPMAIPATAIAMAPGLPFARCGRRADRTAAPAAAAAAAARNPRSRHSASFHHLASLPHLTPLPHSVSFRHSASLPHPASLPDRRAPQQSPRPQEPRPPRPALWRIHAMQAIRALAMLRRHRRGDLRAPSLSRLVARKAPGKRRHRSWRRNRHRCVRFPGVCHCPTPGSPL